MCTMDLRGFTWRTKLSFSHLTRKLFLLLLIHLLHVSSRKNSWRI
uniref:Uncharacterized protein n=1 Tax=Arundo donax TaxID=35708 RepID=A0A0A9EBI3_ARUDO